MKLEAITVCVNYSDFLAEVIPFNRSHFDRWLIVTTPEDIATRDLCRNQSLECITTRDFYRNNAKFDKAKGVDKGMQCLSHADWVLHIDADMILPSHFRESLEDADLDKNCIYGADRFVIKGWDKWQRLKNSGYFHKYSRGGHHYVSFPENFPVGARWADTVQGYVPIGAFQLVNGESTIWQGLRQKRYAPYGHNDAARTDIQFGLQWDRRERLILPEVVCGHLESDDNKTGKNWEGRKTLPFGPSK